MLKKICNHIFTQSAIFLLPYYFVSPAFAQLNKFSFDSLQEVLVESPDTLVKIEVLNRLLTYSNKEDIPKFIDQLDAIGNRIENDSLKAVIYLDLGVKTYFQNDFIRSTSYYFKALKYSTPENLAIKIRLNSNIGWNFQKQDQFETATNYYTQAEQLARELNDRKTLGILLNDIGVLHKNLGHYDLAINYLEESLALNTTVGNERRVLFNINNIGVVYSELEQYDSAVWYYQMALVLNYQRKDTLEIIHNLQNIGQAFYHQGKVIHAIDTLKKCDEFLLESNFLDERLSVNRLLYEIYEKKGDYQGALAYYQLVSQLDDSLFRRGQLSRMKELESKYLFSKNENELQQSRNQVLRHKFNITILTLVLIGALVLIIFLVRIYFIKQKSEIKLKVLNEQINVNSDVIKDANQDLERMVISRTTVIQQQSDKLRKYTFSNSHNLRKPLTSILSLIDLLSTETDGKSRDEMISLLKNAAQEMDKVIVRMSRQLEKDDI